VFYDSALFLPVTRELVPMELVELDPPIAADFSEALAATRVGSANLETGDLSFSIFDTGAVCFDLSVLGVSFD